MAAEVTATKFCICFVDDSQRDVCLDLTSGKQHETFVIKEGAEYRMKIYFNVANEIVSGLRLFTTIARKGITVEKMSYMVGSYGPRQGEGEHEYLAQVEQAPKGMIARGHYVANTWFKDDDRNVHGHWEWSFDVKREWE